MRHLMTTMKSRGSKMNRPAHFTTALLKRLGDEESISVQIEPVWGFVGKITRSNGTASYFRGANFDLNGQGAAEIAADKAYAAYFLKQAGYRVIPTKTFYSPEFARTLNSQDGPTAAYQYAKKIGWPVIIKPNSSSRGELVCLVYDKRGFTRAAYEICEIDRVFLVQPKISGRDYRVVVLDDEVISAYERLPLTITGDGVSAINQLLTKKQKDFARRGRDTIIEPVDFRIDLMLRKHHLNRAAVLSRGQSLPLLANRNLSTGGEAIDVTNKIAASYKNLAVKIAAAMGLRYCGVDLMVDQDITKPINAATNNYRVIEVNAAPGLDHYAESGVKQKRAVKEMYRKILKKLAGMNNKSRAFWAGSNTPPKKRGIKRLRPSNLN